jgi:hypothetical protein
MSVRKIASEFVDLWDELDTDEINKLLAENVSFELLEFFSSYAGSFAEGLPEDLCAEELRGQLPNLLIVGYIIRVLEERLG